MKNHPKLRRVWHYWHMVGVIPRWQLVAVYALVIGLSMAGFRSVHANTTRNTRLANQIQEQREMTIRDNCISQNVRHDRALAQTRELLAFLAPRKSKRADGEVQKWVAAMVPRQDCHAVTQKATHSP